MRLAKLGYSASSSSAFGRTRSRSPDELGNSHSAFREPRVISTTPINNMQEHEKLSWSASPRGTKSPVLDAHCGVLDDVVRSQTDRRIYVSKLEELRAELIRKCPELADSVMKTPTGINSENSRESQEVIDRAVHGGKLDDILQKNLVDSACELEELRALEARIRYETSKSPAVSLCPVGPSVHVSSSVFGRVAGSRLVSCHLPSLCFKSLRFTPRMCSLSLSSSLSFSPSLFLSLSLFLSFSLSSSPSTRVLNLTMLSLTISAV